MTYVRRGGLGQTPDNGLVAETAGVAGEYGGRIVLWFGILLGTAWLLSRADRIFPERGY